MASKLVTGLVTLGLGFVGVVFLIDVYIEPFVELLSDAHDHVEMFLRQWAVLGRQAADEVAHFAGFFEVPSFFRFDDSLQRLHADFEMNLILVLPLHFEGRLLKHLNHVYGLRHGFGLIRLRGLKKKS